MARKRASRPLELLGFEDDEAAHTPLSRERITRTALRLLNECGLKELSMRRVADELSVQTASLYYHVSGKDQLLQLISDAISAEMAWPDESLPWREKLLRWGAGFRRVLLGYRDAAELFGSTIGQGVHRLTEIERLYALLASAGFAEREIPWIASMLKNYVLSFVADEARFSSMTGSGDSPSDGEGEGEPYRRFFEGLPPDRFPQLIRLAAYTTTMNGDEEFGFGLELLLDGLTARLARSGGDD